MWVQVDWVSRFLVIAAMIQSVVGFELTLVAVGGPDPDISGSACSGSASGASVGCQMTRPFHLTLLLGVFILIKSNKKGPFGSMKPYGELA
jgi:hypothetical protein